MKKFFTFMMVLAVASILNVQAQVLQRERVAMPVVNNMHRASITPGANQGWWGFADNDSEMTGLGVNSADTYHCAIFIPGDHAVAGGKTIQAVRFGLVAPNATNVKVWIASQLPSSIDATNCLQIVDVPAADLGKVNIDVALASPYAIPAEGVYVGYSFTITQVQYQSDAYPVIVTGDDQANALLLRTDNSVPSWSDLNGNGFGKLFLQVLLEGQFADNLVTPSDFGSVYAEIGESATADVTLTNNGFTPVSSIDYTITSDGVISDAIRMELASPIAFASRGVVSIPISAEAAQSIKEKTLTITKVNGNANEASEKDAKFTLYSLTKIIDRNVVVEQYTGTGCGWCPRGHAGMSKMRSTFGDRFIGIALHQYSGQSSDAMNIAKNAYAPVSFGGAPSCRLDRGEVIDPYYGSAYDVCDDFAAEMAIPAMCGIAVNGYYDDGFTKVDAIATVESLFDDKYTLEFVLIADGLTGSGTGWNQANYYAQYSQSDINDEYLNQFGAGGSMGTNPISNFVFNDVAIASSYVSGSNTVSSLEMTAGGALNVNCTLTLPVYSKLKNALQKDQLYVAALVVDQNGKIVNGAKTKVTDATSVSGIRTANTTEAARYTLDGRQVSAPQHGINIVKMSDGTIRKVMVK
ncbi:MAG: hemin-binding protein [Prevotella sp.]|jgi:hypothetical protein|nr:hemin-binding protein [Prevotella sp.]